ncbi:MAG: Rrf2 family transcriptional regulator [Hyphomicrobium sp.]
MRLTRYTDLSLRVLFFAGLKHPELSSIPEIAQTYLVPESHLTKVVHELGRAGYLETVRGRGGGLRLAKPLDQINLGEVVRLTESDFKLVECMAPASGNCCLEPSCTLTPVFEKAMKSFFDVLDAFTLEDLLKPRRALAQLLKLAP